MLPIVNKLEPLEIVPRGAILGVLDELLHQRFGGKVGRSLALRVSGRDELELSNQLEFLCAPILTVNTAEDEFCGERGDGLSTGTLMDGRNPLAFNPMMFSCRAPAGFSGNNPMHGRKPPARPTPVVNKAVKQGK